MTMATLSMDDISAIASRHPEVFAGSARKRLTGWLVGAGIVAYLAFAWWFFSMGTVFMSANWSIAGTYLADWVSYETRPAIKFDGNRLDVGYPRFSAYNADRHPDWLAFEGDGQTNRVVADFGGADAVDITARAVNVMRDGERLVVAVDGAAALPEGILPEWASQKVHGGKLIVDFGFAGSAEIEGDEVKVRRRFLGWENFLFDAYSPFWGKPLSEVIALVWSGDRLDPARSNAALAWSNIVNNAEWQHGDVWTKLLQTIVMAFVGTVFASLLAFPLAFAAARNITPNRLVNQAAKRLFDFLRSVDMLIWALFFTRAFGPGPLAGISAIFFTDTGTFGKLYSEALENIDDKQREGVRSVGAAPAVVQRYGVIPQVLPLFASQSLYFWESNTRSATIIGAVGAGGIGLKLWEAMRTNSDWENVAYMVLLILVVVFIFDTISGVLRRRLVG